MTRKIVTVKELTKHANNVWMEKYGKEKLSEMGKLGAAYKLKNDPDYFKKIRAIGIEKKRKRDEEEKKPLNRIAKVLLGDE